MVRILLALLVVTMVVGVASAKDLVPINGGGHWNPRLGGGDWSTATVIPPSLPYNDTGSTCGASWVVDLTCGYTAGVSPDLFYSYTACVDGAINVSLCGSDFDTEVEVTDSNHNSIACDDDFCNFQSEVDNVPVASGAQYFIIISGYYGSCGDYVLNVTGPSCPNPVKTQSWGEIKSIYR